MYCTIVLHVGYSHDTAEVADVLFEPSYSPEGHEGVTELTVLRVRCRELKGAGNLKSPVS